MSYLSMPGFVRRGGVRRVFAGASLGCLAVAGAILVPGPAQAAEAPIQAAACRELGYQLDAGPKLKAAAGFRTEWIGNLCVDGRAGICDDYGLSAPDGQWIDKPAKRRPGSDRATQVEQYIANAHPTAMTDSKTTSAAYKSAINRAVSKGFRSDWESTYKPKFRSLDPQVIKLADAWLADAERNAGPVKVTGGLTSKPLPGGKGRISITATGNGKALTGAQVSWKVSGGKVLTFSKTTTAKGQAVLDFTRGSGPVSFAAVVTSPEWRTSMWSRPTSGKKQHLIRGGVTVKTTITGRFDSFPGITASTKCVPDCKGRPPVTLAAKSSGSPMRWQALVGGKVVKTLEVSAGKTAAGTFTGVDGQRVAFRYQVQVGGKWSGWRTVSRTFDVVCPAVPLFSITGTCDCGGHGMVALHIQAPGGPRTYDVTYGGETKRISGSAAVDFQVPMAQLAGARVTYDALDSAGKRLGGGVLTPWTR